MIDCILLDLDGTISNCSHRLHYIETSPKDWETFFSKCFEDPIIGPVYEIVKQFQSNYRTVITTSRPEKVRELTDLWLREHDIQYDLLLMRKNKEFRKSPVVKSDMIDFIIEQGYNPMIAIDDREDCVHMFIKRGIFTIHIPESNIRGGLSTNYSIY